MLHNPDNVIGRVQFNNLDLKKVKKASIFIIFQVSC